MIGVILSSSSKGVDYSDVEMIKIPLPSGSLLLMSGASQSDWQVINND